MALIQEKSVMQSQNKNKKKTSVYLYVYFGDTNTLSKYTNFSVRNLTSFVLIQHRYIVQIRFSNLIQ